MTNNADAQIAREWASRALKNDLLPIAGYQAAARYILATTTPLPGTRLDLTPRRHAGGEEA